MKMHVFGFNAILMAVALLGCTNPTTPGKESTILFRDGSAVTRSMGSSAYTNVVTGGEGSGAITYASGTPATATVDPNTGAVTPVSVGTTVITASKAADGTHGSVSASYTLTVTVGFKDGENVSKKIEIGTYTNPVIGTGTLSYSSKDAAVATVNATTGEVTLLSGGSTVITVTVAKDASHGELSASYTLAVLKDYTSAIIGTLKYVSAGQLLYLHGSVEQPYTISQPYRMSKCEITQKQFFDIMGTNPSTMVKASKQYDADTDPVQNVCWNHAIAFCNKLSLKDGLTPVYSVEGVTDWAGLKYDEIPNDAADANLDKWAAVSADWTKDGYRLPTVIEWTWAAIGADKDRAYGNTGIGQNKKGQNKPFAGYTGSNSIGDYAWYGSNSDLDGGLKTRPVGQKLPNEIGLYDMSGNVAEWCWDWDGLVDSTPATDFRGPESGTDRSIRGGSFESSASNCLLSYDKLYYPPYSSRYLYGFRVVRL